MRLEVNKSTPNRYFGMNARAFAETERLFTFTITAPKVVHGWRITWFTWLLRTGAAINQGASHPRRWRNKQPHRRPLQRSRRNGWPGVNHTSSPKTRLHYAHFIWTTSPGVTMHQWLGLDERVHFLTFFTCLFCTNSRMLQFYLN